MFGVSACVNVPFEHTCQADSSQLFVGQSSLFSIKGKLCQDLVSESQDQRPVWQFRAESCRLLEMRMLERWQLVSLAPGSSWERRKCAAICVFLPVFVSCTVALKRPCACQIGAARLALHL